MEDSTTNCPHCICQLSRLYCATLEADMEPIVALLFKRTVVSEIARKQAGSRAPDPWPTGGDRRENPWFNLDPQDMQTRAKPLALYTHT